MLIDWLRWDVMPRYTEDDGAPSGGTLTVGDPPVVPDDAAAELERLRKALKAANKEAEAKRKRLEELEATEQTRQQAEMAEVDRVKAQYAATQAQLEQASAELRRHRILASARRAADTLKLDFHPGALDDALALGAFDDLEINDRGDALEINATLKELIKARPYLLKPEAPPTPAPALNGSKRGRTDAGDAAEEKLERNAPRWGIKLPSRT